MLWTITSWIVFLIGFVLGCWWKGRRTIAFTHLDKKGGDKCERCDSVFGCEDIEGGRCMNCGTMIFPK